MWKKSIPLLLLLSLLPLFGCAPTPPIHIGVTQLAVHPALNEARRGFLDVLKEHGYETGVNLHLDIRYAYGDIRTTQRIAEDFAAQGKDLIFAISTPSAQAAYSATKTIPIVFTAVTDPVDAGIAETLSRSGTNVTGTSDGLPMAPQLDLLVEMLPEARTIGVLYSEREANARLQVQQLKEEAALRGLAVLAEPLGSLDAQEASLSRLLSGVDVLYVPTDNTLASGMEPLLTLAQARQIPVVAADAAWVHAGALFALGIDYYQLGRDAGIKAMEVLRGGDPALIPITTQRQPRLHIHKGTADRLGIFLPLEVLETAVIILENGP